MGQSRRQLKAMLRKNWLLKIRHPWITFIEIMLPTFVMLMLIAVRTRVDTRLHPAQAYVRKGMFVEIGESDTSPSLHNLLELWFATGEHLAFAPDTVETRMMLDVLSLRFPLLKMVARIYKDEVELETYIQSREYGTHDLIRNATYPKIKGAIIFHEQGPHLFDYSIRLNHSWAPSGFPDVKTIMDTNGPYLNDLELGVNIVPTLQYGFSGFLTLQQVLDSFIIFSSQWNGSIVSWDRVNGDERTNFHKTQNVSEIDDAKGSQQMFSLFAGDSDNGSPWTLFRPSKISIVPFPTREYTDDEFQFIVKKVMGVLYLLGFLYPVSRLISYSVFEKEQKIREGLHMMGVKDNIFYLSWFITYAIQFAVSAAIITVCTMNNIFQYSNKSVVFMYFFLFGLSAIMLSFLITTFFSRAKTAVAVGTLSFLGAYFPYYTIFDVAVPMSVKVVASLLSPTAFALGTVNFADYERAHVGVRWSNIWEASSGVNFLVCLMMMAFDTILYGAVALYLDKVLPQEHGVQHPWNYFCTPKFWKRKSTMPMFDLIGGHSGLHGNAIDRKDDSLNGTNQSSDLAIESVSLDLKQQEYDGRCIQIRNLRKIYKTTKGKCCAVNSLQLTLYESQILALLGHNGAGKSSTISMLVGLLPPTSGDALIFGKNILTDMEEIRKQLGVCPQHDILFPELTVKEHLEIFGILKGVQDDVLGTEVDQMINEVGLCDKINTIVRALSGGMRRKLSLAIALIGNSKVVILDEPTSGMDPYSMRSTWELIKRIKKGRVILLTTHSMDEADVLGDRIAIMANGSLRCCGSSPFLKHRYGVGYTLTLVKQSPHASAAADIVLRHVPMATLLTDVGSELSFRLPLASASAFEGLFKEIECYIRSNCWTAREKGMNDESYLGIESYGISVTTLEEVFLRVAGCDSDEIEPYVVVNEKDDHMQAVSDACCGPTDLKACSGKGDGCSSIMAIKKFCLAICSSFILILSAFCNFLGLCRSQNNRLANPVSPSFWEHFKALIKKRAICARRDKRTIAFQLLVPALFLFLGLLFLKLKPHPDQVSITLTTDHFNPLLRSGGGGGPIPFNLSLTIAKEVERYVKGGWVQRQKPRSYKFPDAEQTLADAIAIAGPKRGPSLLSMSEFLITSLNESYQSRYGAVVMDEPMVDGSLGYTVLHNSSCQHAAPTYISVVNSAILRLATHQPNMTIRTRNHPLPMTETQHAQHHDLDAFSAAIIVNIAFSFIPASFAVPIVKEREVKAKHQQIISGVSLLAYWISTYVWDFISYLLPASLAMLLFYAFGLEQFVGTDCFGPTLVIMLEYGMAMAALTYGLTFCFTDYSVAQNVVLLVHFFSGLVLMVISFIMGLIPATKHANSLLKNIFRLSPGFCLADGLASLALRRQGMKLGSAEEPLDWNVTGASICYLGLEGVIYFMFVLGIELLPIPSINWMRKAWSTRMLKNKSYLNAPKGIREPFIVSAVESHTSAFDDEDEDVRAERLKVLSGAAKDSIIVLQNLRKVYPGGTNQSEKVAVQSLSFSLQEGECFGFLGTNGAGKTTTLSMLSGEEHPTEGTAHIFGKDIISHPKAAHQHVGYCPQFDALLDLLTVREHLELYARIKGVPKGRLDEVVEDKLTEFDLWTQANKPSSSLSGGNKRKLSVAIAMIGDPPIVILDEPSTGMDPIAKRFMWDVISRISTRRGKTAVILTTHSMNEAQALCTRIGIMVGGRLRCLGSPQHLKNRFGNYLELEVKPIDVSATELENLYNRLRDILFDFPCHPRGILSDLEICMGGSEVGPSAHISEINLSQEMIIAAGRILGNEEHVHNLISNTPSTDGVFGELLSEQLARDGGIPLRIFCEWWLAKERVTRIGLFVFSSFLGATFQGCKGYNLSYQLPYSKGASLAEFFGHLEQNRREVGIAEYSIGQSTLGTIFNHFAANQ